MKMIKLEKIAKVITGFPFKGEKYSNQGIRTVRGENITEGRLRWDTIKCWNEKFDKEEDYLLKENDVVVGMDGSKVGKNKARIDKADLPLLLAQRVACLRTFEKNDQLFLYYLINNPRFEEYVFKTQTGSSVPHISKTQIENFEVPEIDFITQQKIAKVLSDLDAKIELNNKINAELEAMAKTLYDYWFVQFDFPFDFAQGKPDANGKPYKSSGGKMVWNEELKREIPEGWDVGTISDTSELIRGVSYDKKSIKTANDCNVIPILRATNISGNQIDLKDMVYVPNELVNEKQILNKFDILITMSSGSIDHIGKNGFYYYDETVSFGAFCAKFVPKQHYHFYLFSYAQSDFMSNTIKNECLGTNINNLNSGMVNGFKLVIPDNDCLKLFNDKVESLYQKISINYKENQELASLRDWLLPMLMNGQVSVASTNSTTQDVYEVEANSYSIAAEEKINYKK